MSEDFFKAYVQEQMGIITHLCKAYAEDYEDLKDLIQEVTIQLWKSHKNFEGRSKISTWVYRVTLNVCLYYSRQSKKSKKSEYVLPLNIAEVGDDMEREKLESLYRAIRALSESDKALALLYLEDKSYQEMSNILGITVTNVGVKVSRMKERLKKLIQNDEG